MTAMDLFGRSSRILYLGAHCDDVEIGCGATMRRISRLYPRVEVRILVLTSTEERAAEAKAGAAAFAGDADAVTVLGFRDGHLPWSGSETKDAVREATADFAPDLVFAHHRTDLHQDHRYVGELAWQLYRGATILEYEIPKWDGDLSRPNLYVPSDEEDVDFKMSELPKGIRQSDGQTVVRRGGAARPHAAAGHGMPIAQSLRRSLPRRQARGGLISSPAARR